MLKVEKRDGRLVDFNSDKIKIAILKASSRLGVAVPDSLTDNIVSDLRTRYDRSSDPVASILTISKIQEIVEGHLLEFNHELYRVYNEYRKSRDVARYRKSSHKKFMDDISSIANTNILKENANMSGETPSGQMMKIASENSKEYSLKFLVDPLHAKLHEEGIIHIHDNDYYITKTMTCLHYDLKKLFTGGFESEHTHIREPQRIETYAELAAIVFQTVQNEMHGGQSIPAFDFFMAPGVLKSYKSNLTDILASYLLTKGEVEISFSILDFINSIKTIDMKVQDIENLASRMDEEVSLVEKLVNRAYEVTRRQTYQAMESFLYNMETMHSRGGNQVVFSSINYGTDTSPEGRMVMRCLLDATEKGGGKGETFIFPIQIFKLKSEASYDPEAIKHYLKDGSFTEEDMKKAPNLDLFIRACEVSSKRLFPNFINLDASFNTNDKWDRKDPDRWLYETATMG